MEYLKENKIKDCGSIRIRCERGHEGDPAVRKGQRPG